MNYIKHLNAVFSQMDQNEKLSAQHITLYLSLFRRWNSNFFKNPIVVVRDELMRMSRIGSANTYSKCLKELDKFGYIKYEPSFNRHKGSQIYLFTFDKGSEQVVRPFIKQTNNIYTQSENNFNDEILNQNTMVKNNSSMNSSGYGPQIPPSEIHIKIYFNEKGFPPIEAEKFFNYYESNGWLVGGKTKMKDWKAAARNWIINKERFGGRNKSNQSNTSVMGSNQIKLGETQLKTDKNYDTPL